MGDRRLTDEAAQEIRDAIAIVHADRLTTGLRRVMSDYVPKPIEDPKDPKDPKDPPPKDPKDPPENPPRRGIWAVGNEDAE